MERSYAYATVCPLSNPRCGTWLGIGDAGDPARLFVPSGEPIVAYGHHYYSDGKGGQGSTAATAIVEPLQPGEERTVELRVANNPPDFEQRVEAAEAARLEREAAGNTGAEREAEAADVIAPVAPTDGAETADQADANAATDANGTTEIATVDLEEPSPPTDTASGPRLYRIEADGVNYGTVSIQPSGPETFTPAQGFCDLAASCAPEIQIVTGVAATDGTAEGEFTVGEERFRLVVNEETGRAALFPADPLAMLDRQPVSGTLVEARGEAAPPTVAGGEGDPDGIWLLESEGEPTAEACLADHLAVLGDGRLFRGTMRGGAHEVWPGVRVCTREGASVSCPTAQGMTENGTIAVTGERAEVCAPNGCFAFRACHTVLEASDDPQAAALIGLVSGEREEAGQ